MKRWPKWSWGIVLALIAVGVSSVFWTRERPEISAELVTQSTQVDLSGFQQASEPGSVTFPEAFGPHPEYHSEWWYYTGNVQTVEGRKFGYQLTFFRRALSPTEHNRQSALATNQVYMAHFALTDAMRSNFHTEERFQRGAGELAGARAAPYEVWLDDWSVEEVGEGVYKLQANIRSEHDPLFVDFTLVSMREPILHGERGLSRKSTTGGHASYYYSQTHLETYGDIRIGSQRFEVSGSSWKDHEYGTASLSSAAVGWDWFSLQLDDGTALMVFQIRRSDGSIEPASSGTLVTPSGEITHLSQDQIQIEVIRTWTSPHSGGTYPSGWHIRIPGAELELTVVPLIADQEWNASSVYWEGAVEATGQHAGRVVAGYGYVELTGYGGPVPHI